MANSAPDSPDADVAPGAGGSPLISRRARREAETARQAEAERSSAAQPAAQSGSESTPTGESTGESTVSPTAAPDAVRDTGPAAAETSAAAWGTDNNPFAGLGFGTPTASVPADVPAPAVSSGSASPDTASPDSTFSDSAGRPNSRANRRAVMADRSASKPKRSRMGGWGCLIVLVVIVGLMAAGAFALQGPIGQLVAAAQGPEDYEGAGSGEVLVMIHDGDTGSDIATTLVDQDVVKSFDAFYDLLLAQSEDPVFQPGAYLLASQMSAASALESLQDPATRQEMTVMIPEGTAAVDVLESVAEGTDISLADLQAAAADLSGYGLPAEATTLEGFLFPATYTFKPATSAHDAIKTLVDRQFEALDDAGVAPADRWKIIVMASLIQREAGLKDDYYKVAKVFYNRLDPAQWDSGLLQSDATVAYGTGNTHLVTTTDAERGDANNRYNTYAHPGLPVGPISNPGDLAIDAALHPADGTWLYFVTWNLDTGETIFSTTAQEHQDGVDKWLAWMDEHPEYG